MDIVNRVRRYLSGKGDKPASIQSTFAQAKSDYAGELAKASYSAARSSKFRRTRHQLGGTADAHYAVESEYWQLREYARDMDRNDAVVGQMIDRAVSNILRNGMTLQPATGNPELDQEIKERWREWAEDPYRCDAAGRLSFCEMESLVLRHVFVDGDVFALLPSSGTGIQLLEGDRITSKSSQNDNIVHGVELDEIGTPIAYHLSKQTPEMRERLGKRLPYELDRRPARDEDGNPNILHIFAPKRITQSRGVTCLAPVFDLLGMFEDTNFAKLVQQQVVSCVGMFITRQSDYQFGPRTTETSGGFESTFEELEPGAIVRLRDGEDIKGFSPNVPNSEWFAHCKQILRLIGASVGLPLSLVTLDTSDTTFHGYRGELQQARMGFERIQKWLPARFHRHVYLWWLRREFPEAPTSHYWRAPGWPYVDPEKDGKADVLALENMLDSPRDLMAKRGKDWHEVVRETVADRSLAVAAAIEAAQKINEATGEMVAWRELLNLRPPAGLSISANLHPEQGAEPAPEEPTDG